MLIRLVRVAKVTDLITNGGLLERAFQTGFAGRSSFGVEGANELNFGHYLSVASFGRGDAGWTKEKQFGHWAQIGATAPSVSRAKSSIYL